MKSYCKIYFQSIVVLICMVLFFSCENDIQTVNAISAKDTLPVESAKDVEIIYSDSGIIELLMTTPVLDRFEIDNNPYTEMPKGLKVLFYDSLMNVKSWLTANYAISYENKDIMEAKNDVVVLNEKNEKLNTEHLIWDQTKKIIYSNEFVKITTNDEVLFGEGFESDERFNKWVIKKPTGVITINQD